MLHSDLDSSYFDPLQWQNMKINTVLLGGVVELMPKRIFKQNLKNSLVISNS